MIWAATLSLYIGRQFTTAVLSMIGALSLIVALFDYIELLRRSVSQPGATFAIVTEIAAMRLPFIAIEILPFAVLLGGIAAFWRLTRSSELVVARAAGLSAWDFLAAPLIAALLLGGVATTLVSPLSSVLLARAEALDDAYLSTKANSIDLAGSQLWLRQSDRALNPDGVAIMHVLQVSIVGGLLTGNNVSIFRLDPADRLLQRIEAPHAALLDGAWRLDQARVIAPDKLPTPPRQLSLPTDLSVNRVQESFASPDTLSFWQLPGFIALLQRSGFSAIRHRLHFQSLLALPLLAGTMALVAAGFSMRPTRRGGTAQMIGSGVAAGFALFVISKIAQQFGDTGVLPTLLAAWAPAAVGLMLALSLLLHLEDG
jgi:lipopolysaccharide export system permease protein